MVNQCEQRQNSIFNAGLQMANWNAYNTAFAVDPTTGQSTIDANDANAMQAASSQYQMMQQKNAVLAQQAKLFQENVFEQFRTAQLEPLQQLEESLAMEKASLETRLDKRTVRCSKTNGKRFNKRCHPGLHGTGLINKKVRPPPDLFYTS